MKSKRHILPIIVIAQFCGTSIWFASNGVIKDLINVFQLDNDALGNLTSAVQFGFISGTLIFALLSIADRFSPSRVFFICAILGALSNLCIAFDFNNYVSLIGLRFLTGITLAGIYPVGMKLAADHFEKGLGTSLGFLVGALVLGKSFPYLLSIFKAELDWQSVIFTVSGFAAFGGLIVLLFVPDGPYRKAAQSIRLNNVFQVFKPIAFRKAAFGYFGHMWELYTFWVFMPVLLGHFSDTYNLNWNVYLYSFYIIAKGAVGCILAGYISRKIGSSKVAFSALGLSGLSCLLAPLIFLSGNPALFFVFMMIWGLAVVADSPMFSTMVAQSAIPTLKGTALTIVNCIGFAITIISIQLLTHLKNEISLAYLFMLLAAGPAFSILYKLSIKKQPSL